MTYCVGIEVNDGLVFAADTRTSASFEHVHLAVHAHVVEGGAGAGVRGEDQAFVDFDLSLIHI